MTFFCRAGWTVSFLEPDLRTPIGRIRHFATIEKVRELVDRTATRLSEAERYELDHDIEKGRGGLYLMLTQEQYGKLWR